MRIEMLDPLGNVFLIHDFLDPAECKGYIAQGEALGFSPAPLTTSQGPLMAPEVRNNTRVMLDDPSLARFLWNRARPMLPPCLLDSRDRSSQAIGLNERFRFFRYEPGQRFARHYDGAFHRDDREASLLTFMVYLNDDFTGGYTNFYTDRQRFSLGVKPQTGSALVFIHNLLHEGERVKSGVKYVLRTDVMYRVKTHTLDPVLLPSSRVSPS